MSVIKANVNQLICAEHSQRLSNIDSNLQQLIASGALSAARLDAFCTNLDTKLVDIHVDLQGLHTVVNEHSNKLDPLVRADARLNQRRSNWRGVGWAVVTAGVIGFYSRFGDTVIALLSKL